MVIRGCSCRMILRSPSQTLQIPKKQTQKEITACTGNRARFMLQAEKQVGSPPWCRNILQPEHHTHASLTSKCELQNKDIELSNAKFDRLMEQGVEPYPGPHCQPGNAVCFEIVSINLQVSQQHGEHLKRGKTVS